MSLIQQALEKTSRAQETRTSTPVPAQKIWDRDPMGAALEQELIRVQESHAARRSLYWKITVAVLLALSVTAFFYFNARQPAPVVRSKTSEATKAASVAIPVRQAPVKIYSGNIYRLTGVTDLGGHPIAVINGRLLGIGDTLDGKATIKEIGKGEVVLDVQGRELKLVL